MSLCDCRGLFANDKEVARRRSGAASRDNDEVIHKKPRQACRRINQWFLNFDNRLDSRGLNSAAVFNLCYNSLIVIKRKRMKRRQTKAKYFSERR